MPFGNSTVGRAAILETHGAWLRLDELPLEMRETSRRSTVQAMVVFAIGLWIVVSGVPKPVVKLQPVTSEVSFCFEQGRGTVVEVRNEMC